MKCKIACVMVVLGFAVLLNGCAPVGSIFALYKRNDKVFEKDLIGVWKPTVTDPDDSSKDQRWTFEKSEVEKFYNFKLGAAGAKGGFVAKARLVRIGSFLFIDFEGDSDEAMDSENNLTPYPIISVHMMGRVWLKDNTLQIHFLKDDWVKEQAKAGTLSLAHLDVDDDLLLTANTDELRTFMQEHADDKEALSDNYIFARDK